MQRYLEHALKEWLHRKPRSTRKPLILRGARQVGKSYIVRAFCARNGLRCAEINFEKTPALKDLFVPGDNAHTIALLETHFGGRLAEGTLLFLDEIQAAPEVFARLRYFYEESKEIPVIAAGSLLEFALAELEHSMPVGRIEYMHLGPMRIEEYLLAVNETALLDLIRDWRPGSKRAAIPAPFHDRLLGHARDFSLVGGMPEAIVRFSDGRDFLGCESAQRAILDTYRQDFAKYRNRVPLERLERIFVSISAQVGRKWVHARVNPSEKAQATEAALDALCKARVAHRIHHSSGNGVPFAAERKDNLYKVLFLDVGLMGLQLGLRPTELVKIDSFERVNEGAVAEQWIGQHLLDLRATGQAPELHYWVREVKGALAEVDYLLAHGPRAVPVEVKAGPSTKARSLQVFLDEKRKSEVAVHFSSAPAGFDRERRILKLPFYLVEQLPRVLDGLREGKW